MIKGARLLIFVSIALGLMPRCVRALYESGPSDADVRQVSGYLKGGVEAEKAFKKADQKELRAREDAILLLKSWNHVGPMPRRLYDLLGKWQIEKSAADESRTLVEAAYGQAVLYTMLAYRLVPSSVDIKFGPFQGQRAEFQPRIETESETFQPSTEIMNPQYNGPMIAAPVPASSKGFTAANGEVRITVEGLNWLKDLLRHNRDGSAVRLLGFILMHEQRHFENLDVPNGWKLTLEEEEYRVRSLMPKEALENHFNPKTDADIIARIEEDNRRVEKESFILRYTPEAVAKMFAMGHPLIPTPEQMERMRNDFISHSGNLIGIQKEQAALEQALDEEREARRAGRTAPERQSQPVDGVPTLPAGRAVAAPQAAPLAPAPHVELDTLGYLYRFSVQACAQPFALQQDTLDRWWNALPARPYDENSAGTLKGCERIVFLKLLLWKSQGINLVRVDDVQQVVPKPPLLQPYPAPGRLYDDDGSRQHRRQYEDPCAGGGTFEGVGTGCK